MSLAELMLLEIRRSTRSQKVVQGSRSLGGMRLERGLCYSILSTRATELPAIDC